MLLSRKIIAISITVYTVAKFSDSRLLAVYQAAHVIIDVLKKAEQSMYKKNKFAAHETAVYNEQSRIQEE